MRPPHKADGSHVRKQRESLKKSERPAHVKHEIAKHGLKGKK